MTDVATDSIVIPPGMRSPCGRLRVTRVCRLDADGTLRSPFRGTVWGGSVMRADRFAADGAVRERAGLHAVWRLRGVRPEGAEFVIVHCLAEGQCRVGPEGVRAETLIVQRIVLHENTPGSIVQAVRQRYAPARVQRARPARRTRVLLSDGGVASYRDGRPHGIWRCADGSVVRYRDGRPHGIWRYDDGSILRWRDGVLIPPRPRSVSSAASGGAVKRS